MMVETGLRRVGGLCYDHEYDEFSYGYSRIEWMWKIVSIFNHGLYLNFLS